MDDEPDRLSNRLLEYDPNTNKWTELCPMKYSKYRCSAVVLNGEIFVMGKTICSISMHIIVMILLNDLESTDFCKTCHLKRT